MQIYQNMTLDDLKTGMIVTTRNGMQFTVIRNAVKPWNNSTDLLIYTNMDYRKYNYEWKRGCFTFSSFNEDMRAASGNRKWDIVKVETADLPFGFMDLNDEPHRRSTLWCESNKVKLTVAEIESRLGYKIEIVSDNEEE